MTTSLHEHEHTHEITFAGKPVHEDIKHVHPHSKEFNEHHHYVEDSREATRDEKED